MHKCQNCGHEFHGKYCPECGEAWQEEKTCPNCGAVLPGNVKFCETCGHAFIRKPTAPAAPSAIQRKLYAALPYIPLILFGLFSALMFFFYIAPAAVMPGGSLMGQTIPSESYGNVYQFAKYRELSATLANVMLTLIVMSELMIVFAAVWAVYAISVRKTHLAFEIVGLAFWLVQLILASVLMGEISKWDSGLGVMQAGAAPQLVLSFAVIASVFSAAAVGARYGLPKVLPSFSALENERNRRDAERRAALPAPTPPEQIPKKPVPPEPNAIAKEVIKLEKHKRFLILLAILSGICVSGLFQFVCFESFADVWIPFDDPNSLLTSGVVPLLALTLWWGALSLSSVLTLILYPILLRKKRISATVKSATTRFAFFLLAPLGAQLLILLMATIIPFVGAIIRMAAVGTQHYHLERFFSILRAVIQNDKGARNSFLALLGYGGTYWYQETLYVTFLFVPLTLLYLILTAIFTGVCIRKSRKIRLAIYGTAKVKPNSELLGERSAEWKEYAEKVEGYRTEVTARKAAIRARKLYRYQSLRYKQGLPYEKAPPRIVRWVYVHRITSLIAVAVLTVCLIVATVVPLNSASTKAEESAPYAATEYVISADR